jgi:antitoxin (DNA-binding transcriptional repressor) of toxin-antitoxin stability system
MKEIGISEFRVRCLAIINHVNKTKKPVRITRYGKPIAEVAPPGPPKDNFDWIGSMKGKMEILGDIVSPVIDASDVGASEDSTS